MSNEPDKSLVNGLQVAVCGASSSDLPDVVKIMYTDNDIDTNLLEDELKEKIPFMELIWTDAKSGGELYKTIYNGVNRQQIIDAGRPGTHAEVLAVNELIKELKAAGKFNSPDDFKKISLLTKGFSEQGELRLNLCVHCFYLLDGVRMIGF